MNVNVYNSSGKSSGFSISDINENEKFVTLTKNLVTKVSKNGDVMTGNLNMGSNKITSSFIPTQDDELINKKYLDEVSFKKMNDDDYQIIMNNLSLKLHKSGGSMTGDLNMGTNKITSSFIPTHDDDIINKKYIDARFVQNGGGLISDLTSNALNKSGFKVSASSSVNALEPYYAFNVRKGSWMCNLLEHQWIKIELPEAKIIYKIALRGTSTNRISKWALYGSKNDNLYMEMYQSGENCYLGDTNQYFKISDKESYSYIKFEIQEAESQTPVLNHFQLFTLDAIV